VAASALLKFVGLGGLPRDRFTRPATGIFPLANFVGLLVVEGSQMSRRLSGELRSLEIQVDI
jgi:hypothetical protein